MVTIKGYGEGICIWCGREKEGVDLVSDDRSFTGFLCFADLKRLLPLKAATANSQEARGITPLGDGVNQDGSVVNGWPGLSQNGRSSGGSPWTIPVGTCAIVGVIPRSASTERVPMPTIPQRIASAFAVLCGRYGDVTADGQGP